MNRLYTTSPLNALEPEDSFSPIHRNIYNNPYTPSRRQHHHFNSLTACRAATDFSNKDSHSNRSSDNALEDSKLTETELALTLCDTLPVHNGK